LSIIDWKKRFINTNYYYYYYYLVVMLVVASCWDIKDYVITIATSGGDLFGHFWAAT
jgi:hypothetical protein